MAPAAAAEHVLKRTLKCEEQFGALYTGGRIATPANATWFMAPCGEDVAIVDIQSGKVVANVEGDGDIVTSVAVSQDGSRGAVASRTLVVRSVSLTGLGSKLAANQGSSASSSLEVERTIRAGTVPATAMEFDATGVLLCTGFADGLVRVWDIERGYCTHNFRGHEGAIRAAAFHPNPKKLELFTGSEDTKLRAWDLSARKCRKTLDLHDGVLTSIAFLPDASALVTVGRDKMLNIVDTKRLRLTKSLPAYEVLEDVAVVPARSGLPGSERATGKFVCVTAGERRALRVWDPESGKQLFEEEPEDANATVVRGDGSEGSENVVFQQLISLPNNRFMVVVSDTRLVIRGSSELAIEKQMIGYNDEVIDMRMLPALDPEETPSRELVVASTSPQLRIFNTETRDCKLLYGHADVILAVDVSTSGKYIATASKDHAVRVWGAATMQCVALCEGHTDAVSSVAFSRHSDDYLVTGAADKTVKTWLLGKALRARKKQGSGPDDGPVRPSVDRSTVAHAKDVNCVAVAPNDQFFASASQDKMIKLWDLRKHSSMAMLKGHRRGVWCVAFSPVDRVLASSSTDKTIKLWSLNDFACLKTLEGHTGSVVKVSFLTHGMQLLSAGGDGVLRLWTIKTGECEGVFEEHDEKVWTFCHDAEEKTFISGGSDAKICVWKDHTSEMLDEELKKREEIVALQQKMSNFVAKGELTQAFRAALELDHPHSLRKVCSDLVERGEGEKIEAVTKELSLEDHTRLLGYVREWNTNAKHSIVAQSVLGAVLRAVDPAKLAADPRSKEIVEALILYSQRHYERSSRLLQSSFVLDYTLESMKLFAAPIASADEISARDANLPKRVSAKIAGASPANAINDEAELEGNVRMRANDSDEDERKARGKRRGGPRRGPKDFKKWRTSVS